MFAEDEARLLIAEAASPGELDAMVERRIGGLPLEHVLGWAEFGGLRIQVDPGVFVPRTRTGLLVEQAVSIAGPGAVVVDLCCGSGAVGAALAHEVDRVELHAVDIDPAAVRCARRNVKGSVYQGDLYDPLPETLRGRVDILVANAPYVPTGAIGMMPPEARLHEPRAALDGGADGLDILRRVTVEAPDWLAPGGHLLFEAGQRQVPDAVDMVAGAGLVARVAHDAEHNATVIVAARG